MHRFGLRAFNDAGTKNWSQVLCNTTVGSPMATTNGGKRGFSGFEILVQPAGARGMSKTIRVDGEAAVPILRGPPTSTLNEPPKRSRRAVSLRLRNCEGSDS